jgi:hypothetical protein
MTAAEFQLLREERPELRFPTFHNLLPIHQYKILKWTKDRVIAERCSVLLDFGACAVPAISSLPTYDYDPQEMEPPATATA